MDDAIAFLLTQSTACSMAYIWTALGTRPCDRRQLETELRKSAFIASTPQKHITHQWVKQASMLMDRALTVVNVVSWATDTCVPDPVAFNIYIMTTHKYADQLHVFADNKVRRKTTLNAIDCDSLQRGIVRLGIHGICRNVIVQEYADAYADLHYLLHTRKLFTLDDRVWATEVTNYTTLVRTAPYLDERATSKTNGKGGRLSGVDTHSNADTCK